MLATVVGYCVKCKAKRDMENPKQITMKNGRLATEGTCGTCGTRMFKIGGGSISAGSSGSKAVAKKPVKSKAVAKKPVKSKAVAKKPVKSKAVAKKPVKSKNKPKAKKTKSKR